MNSTPHPYPSGCKGCKSRAPRQIHPQNNTQIQKLPLSPQDSSPHLPESRHVDRTASESLTSLSHKPSHCPPEGIRGAGDTTQMTPKPMSTLELVFMPGSQPTQQNRKGRRPRRQFPPPVLGYLSPRGSLPLPSLLLHRSLLGDQTHSLTS